MIELLRIDARILHGQVVSAWIPHLGVDEVVVVDDEVAASPMMERAMTLALPPRIGAKVIPFAAVEPGLGAAEAGRSLLLVRDVAEAKRVVDAGLGVSRLNLGNVYVREGRIRISPSLSLSEADLAVLESIAARGIEVEARALPSDPALSLDELRLLVRSAP